MIPLKNLSIFILVILLTLNLGSAIGQLDERFGSGGVEGTKHLGQEGLKWYRDWQDSYSEENYPQSEKNKFWTVGKIDYRSDSLGIDWKWIILDLLEDTNINLLENLLNLCLSVTNQYIILD